MYIAHIRREQIYVLQWDYIDSEHAKAPSLETRVPLSQMFYLSFPQDFIAFQHSPAASVSSEVKLLSSLPLFVGFVDFVAFFSFDESSIPFARIGLKLGGK